MPAESWRERLRVWLNPKQWSLEDAALLESFITQELKAAVVAVKLERRWCEHAMKKRPCDCWTDAIVQLAENKANVLKNLGID